MPLSYTEAAVTEAEADAYAQLRGWSDWAAASATDKPAALRRGQDYIAGTYNSRWAVEFEDDDAPDEVKFAVIEAARRELNSPGSLAPDFQPLESVKRIKKKVGDLEKETEYRDAAANAMPVFAVIDGLLAGLIAPKAGNTTFGFVARA